VKVFSPVNVSTAEPVLVSPIELPEMTPEIVPPAESFTVELAERATVPDNVPAAEKFTAPAADTPVPAIVSGSATVLEVAISSVAPLVTVVDERVPAFSPRPVLLETFNVPSETDVLPVYAFAADNVNVPKPEFVNVPVLVAIGSRTVTTPVFAANVNW